MLAADTLTEKDRVDRVGYGKTETSSRRRIDLSCSQPRQRGMTIFEKPEDFAAFEQFLEEAVERTKTRLLAYCVMSSHWLCEAQHNQCYVKLGIM